MSDAWVRAFRVNDLTGPSNGRRTPEDWCYLADGPRNVTELETIECLLCGGGGADPVVIRENGYSGHQCQRCGLIYVSPRPSKDAIANLYGHDQAHIKADAHIAENTATEVTARLSARHHLAIIRSLVPSGELLEIGAGAGYFLDEARIAGFTPHAIELNPRQAATIRDRGVPCEERPLDATSFGGKRFDVIYHCDVLSHFHNPVDELTTMRGHLAEGGLLVMETGNLADVSERERRYFRRFQYPDHLFFFGTTSLRNLLDKSGFELVKLQRYSVVPHLVAVGWVREAYGKLRRRPAGDPVQGGAPSTGGTPLSRSRRWPRPLTAGWGFVNYALRYKLGALVVRPGAPQTVIIIARERGRSVSLS